jgi:hypothetical protein
MPFLMEDTGHVRVELPASIRAVLATVLRAHLREVQANEPDAVCFADPSVHDDAALEIEYRCLLGNSNLEDHTSELTQVIEMLDRDRLNTGEANRWLAAFNTVRMTHAARLGLLDDERDYNPEERAVACFELLTAVVGTLTLALTDGE